MSRSSGYSSRDDIRMDILNDPERQWSGNRRPEVSVSPDHNLSSQHRPYSNRGATEHQFNPRISSDSGRPTYFRTLSQPRHSIHRRPAFSRQNVLNDLPSRNMGDMLAGELSSNIPLLMGSGYNQSEEHHATQIVSEMEKDSALMEDNPLSEQLRMETLREMPESLTMKRSIRKKLVKSVSQKSRHFSLGMWKRFKYRISMSITKLNVAFKNVLYTMELWYSSLKQIEGHFGSGVATYFRFLRWLLLLNSIVFIVSFGFIVIPQFLYRFYEPLDQSLMLNLNSSLFEETSFMYNPGISVGIIQLQENANSTLHLVTPVPITTENWRPAERLEPKVRNKPYALNEDFNVGNIFTGEGFFTDTTLFYGYYTNESVSTVSGLLYHMPPAYFFTVLACYLIIFFTLSVSMARSYRKTFIETTGDLKNVFSHKIFCGWDFSIATSEAAALKSKSMYNELTELLEDLEKEEDELNCRNFFYLWLVRVFLNVLIGLILAGIGSLIWFLLGEEMGIGESTSMEHNASMMMPLIITIIMMVAPVIFSYLARYEDYSNPRTSLFVTLTRTFLMEMVVIGVVVAFWLTYKKSSKCWETSLGQEVYRLVIIDFFLAVVGTTLAEFLRFFIYKSLWKKIGVPEFDIARNTLNLIYNQTLLFVGFYFSPLLAFIVVLKMFITFYVKKFGVLTNCQPSARPWRAAQTQTLFLVLSFVTTLVVLILLGYIVTQVESSECGPFRSYSFPYEMILAMFQVSESNGFVQFIKFLTKPGVIAGILLAMCIGVYYLRAKSHAHRRMVHILREMLILEAKDKEFLLSSISKVTEGQWIYNLKSNRNSDADWSSREQQLRKKNDNFDSKSSSSASAVPDHASQSSLNYSDSLVEGDGINMFNGNKIRSGFRAVQRRQYPSHMSDMDIHYESSARPRTDGLRDRRY